MEGATGLVDEYQRLKTAQVGNAAYLLHSAGLVFYFIYVHFFLLGALLHVVSISPKSI